MFTPNRRQVLSMGALVALSPRSLIAQTHPRETLTTSTRVLDVNGRAATVFGILNERGQSGLVLNQADGFHVRVMNRMGEPTVLHWHGLVPPVELDGSHTSQPLIPDGQDYDYEFDLPYAGTNWVHSHHGLQEQHLLAAPLIVRSASDEQADLQEVVMMLHDFSFTPAVEIMEGLLQGEMGMMDHSQMMMDLNDVEYDAFLTNDRTLDDPEIVTIDPSSRVRLRIINGAASSNFWIDLGGLSGALVATDGRECAPMTGSRFEIGIAQRLDIELQLPSAGAFPIFAQVEGLTARTGLVLATPGARIKKLSVDADTIADPVRGAQDTVLKALDPLPARKPNRQLTLNLTGNMMQFNWGLNGESHEAHTPLEVQAGERVLMLIRNATMMSHPIHLHGHHFQLIAPDQRLTGPIRDTVIVSPMQQVVVAFDANNPGEWPLHCHNLYHMAAGMMTSLRYV